MRRSKSHCAMKPHRFPKNLVPSLAAMRPMSRTPVAKPSAGSGSPLELRDGCDRGMSHNAERAILTQARHDLDTFCRSAACPLVQWVPDYELAFGIFRQI